MRGRAGRKGKDTVGETYLICQKADLEAISEIWDAETPAINSCLAQDNKGVKRCVVYFLLWMSFTNLLCFRALLEAIATRLVSSREAIDEFMRCTLLCKTREEPEIEKLIETSLQELVDKGLIRLRDDESYESTKLGAAIVASSFSPDDGIFVYEELKRALQAFVMDGEMHIFYMFTPLSVAMNTNIDWLVFRDQLDLLDESGIRALLFVGVQPGFVNNMYVHPSKEKRYVANNYIGYKLVEISKKMIQSSCNCQGYIIAHTRHFNYVISAMKSRYRPSQVDITFHEASYRLWRKPAMALQPAWSSSAREWDGVCSPLSSSICAIDFRQVPEMIFSKWPKLLMSRVGRRGCCGKMDFGVCAH
jgi:hypothetical protein